MSQTTPTLDTFLVGVTRYHADNKDDLRYGQCLFNALAHLRPDLSEQIRGSLMDPFYCEKHEVKYELWEWLATNW